MKGPVICFFASLLAIVGIIYITANYVKTPTIADNIMLLLLLGALTMLVASAHDILMGLGKNNTDQ